LQRVQNAHRVGDAQPAQPERRGRLRELKEKFPVRARGILGADGEKLKRFAKFIGEFDERPQNPRAIFFPGAQVNFRNRQ